MNRRATAVWKLAERSESQMDFEAILEMSSTESVALLAIARILLRDSEGDGEAGAIAKELERRSREL